MRRGRPIFPGIGVIGVKSRQKTRKNRGPSESSPRCLNAVNPAVGFSAPKYQLPEKTCGKRTGWLTGAPINQRVGLFRSHHVGPAKGACIHPATSDLEARADRIGAPGGAREGPAAR